MIRVEFAEDPFQPDIEEGREVRVIDAAVVGRVSDDGIEGLVVVEEPLCVAPLNNRRFSDCGECSNAKGLPIQREWKTPGSGCQGTDL